jgi:pimeloyl-ACP methyl ester carboxylesterase
MQPYPGLERWARQVRLPASGDRLFLYDTGGDDRPPVLLLHGLGDEADTWRGVLALIAAEFRAVAPDFPGFGRSDQAWRRSTVPFFVATLLELLDVLAISRTVLVGHSAGAVIAQALTLDHPERVERLVLIGGSLVLKENRFDPALLAFLVPGLGEWAYTRLRKDPQAAYRSLEPYYNKLVDLPQAERDFLYRRVNERVWSDGQRRGFLSTLRGLVGWLPAQQKKLPERLRGWQVPTTLLWGENDRIASIENARALVELLPSARLVTVPGAGHNLHQEQPEVVAKAIALTP